MKVSGGMVAAMPLRHTRNYCLDLTWPAPHRRRPSMRWNNRMTVQMPFGASSEDCDSCSAPQPRAVPFKAPWWPGVIIVIVMIGASTFLAVSGRADAAAIAVEAVVTATWAAVEIARRLQFLPVV